MTTKLKLEHDDLHCFVCNNRAGASVRNYVAIFGENANLDLGKKLSDVLSLILDNSVEENKVHSSILCKKCYKTCVEFNEIYARMAHIKSEMLNQFRSTLPVYGIECENTTKEVELSPRSKKSIVLPASKLKPLPPDFVILNRGNIKVGKLSAVLKKDDDFPRKKTQPSSTQPQILLKTTTVTAPSTTTQKVTETPKSSSVPPHNLIFVPVQKRITENGLGIASKSVDTDKTVGSDRGETSKPTLTLDATILNQNNVASLLNPNNNRKAYRKITVLEDKQLTSSSDIAENPDVLVAAHNDGSLMPSGDLNAEKHNHLEDIPDKIDDLENNDDHPMEIDEDCSNVGIPQSPSGFNAVFKEHIENSKKTEEKSNERMFNLSLLEATGIAQNSEEDKYVIGKVEIINGEDDQEEMEGYDEDTILMEEDEDGSIIRVVSGKQLVYGNDEMSFEYQKGDSDSDCEQNNDGAGYGSEAHDSNEDDSHIELQVSGDEETANAIIAAAKEQGGAFIKTESGIMYRVKTIESKLKTEKSDSLKWISTSMVKRNGDQYTCLICEKNSKEDPEVNPKSFSGTAYSITQHIKFAHDARIYICQICGEVIRRRNDYIKHIAEHGGSAPSQTTAGDKAKQHVCTVCQKKYSSRNLLLEHMNVHSGARPYSCDVCDKTFASKYTHQAHLKTHLNRPRPFKCKQCDKSFFTQQNLNQHKRTHSGVKDFVCNVCGKAFATQHNLVVHGVVHTGQRPFVCGICSKSFARRAEIRDHIRTHTGERPFSCDVCSATFSQRSNLRSHKRATHLDDKRHACEHCDKRFKRRRLLDYHIKATHTGERPYKCTVCRATFVYPEHFKKHSRIHSGEKPFVCEVCGKSFSSRDNRNAHRFVHSDKKPYECALCGAGFMRKPLLLAHMNSAGHLTETIVLNQPRVSQVTCEDGIIGHSIDMNAVKVTENLGDTYLADADADDTAALENASEEDSQNNQEDVAPLKEGERRILLRGADDQMYTVNLPANVSEGDVTFTTDEGKTTLNVVQDVNDRNILASSDDGRQAVYDDVTLTAINDDVKQEAGMLQGSHRDEEMDADDDALEATADADGIIRLVQIQLSDGNTGWAMINS